MRLPPVEMPIVERGEHQVREWSELVGKAAQLEKATGRNDAFERMIAVLRDMASTGRFDGLVELLRRRISARALSWLWLNDEVMVSRLLNPRLLQALVEAQQPRLTRMTLQQLAHLYFRRFDELDAREGMRKLLERTLCEQLDKLPASRLSSSRADPLQTLKSNGEWLLGLEGPSRLAEKVRDEGRELGEVFVELGLQGFDDGRYGDICRAHFYLETLRDLPLGEWDSVMDELLKPTVNKAPYEGSRRIGHVALEILIDRAGQEPGEAWQNFILNLAGDPRIASSASNYREWWLPLGEERIQKVRGWLSKEDLRLFLQAVEQYGIETNNLELKRMFPARKLFLEGLFRLKLIRNTRLLLGDKAKQSVKRILGQEVKTSFARMEGQMSDKAVIYLDCGDFHLVEGSHSFKIWVYLAAPGEALRSYERNTFSHADLTSTIPGAYKKLYPRLPYDAFVHTPHTWQNKVFSFLAENGISLDIEQLLSRNDYKLQLAKFGIPVVNSRRTVAPPPSAVDVVKPDRRQPQERIIAPSKAPSVERAPKVEAAARELPSPGESLPSAPAPAKSATPVGADLRHSGLPYLSALELAVLRQLLERPGSSLLELVAATGQQGGTVLNAQSMLTGSLKAYVQSRAAGHWVLNALGTQLLDQLSGAQSDITAPPMVVSNIEPKRSRIEGLKPSELKVLRYFASNPGDKVRYAANVFGVEAREINQILYGALKKMCGQDAQYGWHLTDDAMAELEAYDQQQRDA